ncbi:cobyrinic acid a,c-diamide synthase [Paenibacillus sp. MY03]|jgi:flagellar biosynthesis protein FlhG|uniref:MinD/ParA family protein n=1 Tax=Paenibacillus sp. MY03 TaxID=302980 RepID=UPI000B3C03A1|nr:MinD/ParA family protein [Paenibacillus sp. MY03]OUS71581.1 cobyrinic acid a,c-diamide synthase [Paenibacillus sp. MY03]
MNDQAEALRYLVKQQENHRANTRIITVTSGKGGVGKSNFSLNFALALKRQGKKVLIFDADIGMANIDVLMGTSSTYSLYHLLKQEKTIWDIIQLGVEGIHYIAGGSGFRDLLELSSEQINRFASEVEKLHGEYDVILFDTGAGLSKETVRFIAAAQETIVVTTPEPTSITDAYALIKMVKSMGIDAQFKLIVNRASDAREGKETAEKISLVASRFLHSELPSLGTIPDDSHVSKAVKRQIPFLIAYPNSGAAIALCRIAEAYMDIPATASGNGGVKGFITKLFRLAR